MVFVVCFVFCFESFVPLWMPGAAPLALFEHTFARVLPYSVTPGKALYVGNGTVV